MDALITTILAGVVVAVIGAFAAYYFGGRRERQKQVYEERRDVEKQREAKQDVLRERGGKALAKTQTQASVVVEDVKSWAANAARLPENMPKTEFFWVDKTPRWVRQLLPKYAEVVQQRDSIAAQM